MTTSECQSKRYDPRPCEGPAKFQVVTRTPDGKKVLDRRPCCLRHGIAEADRHYASAGMARVEVEED